MMEIRVSGHQIDTGNALRSHVETRLNAMAEKYFSRTLSASVTFGPAPHGAFRCDIVCHVMAGLLLKGSGIAQDAHIAFDTAADRIDKQLRRYMRRLKARHEQAAAAEAERSMVIHEAIDDASYTVFEAPAEDEEVVADAPLVVAEMRVDIPEASVSDAVMMLDLRNTNALMFVNSATSAFNMVYRRNDGTIGWVEPAKPG
jgi:ribosomal subunit interface protein